MTFVLSRSADASLLDAPAVLLWSAVLLPVPIHALYLVHRCPIPYASCPFLARSPSKTARDRTMQSIHHLAPVSLLPLTAVQTALIVHQQFLPSWSDQRTSPATQQPADPPISAPHPLDPNPERSFAARASRRNPIRRRGDHVKGNGCQFEKHGGGGWKGERDCVCMSVLVEAAAWRPLGRSLARGLLLR